MPQPAQTMNISQRYSLVKNDFQATSDAAAKGYLVLLYQIMRGSGELRYLTSSDEKLFEASVFV